MFEIFHHLPIDVNKKTIYEAVTTQASLSRWWTRDCVAEPKVGFINEFNFGELIHNKMKVVELEENRYAEWEVIESVEEWLGTKISFEIVEKEGLTFLTFRHTGYNEANDFYASCNYNWGRYMISLKKLCETGKGDPFVPEMDTEELRAVRNATHK